MTKIGNEKKDKTSKKKVIEEVSGTKSFQVKMDAQVHSLLKKRAKQIGLPIGEFIQNILSSLEYRLDEYKERIGFEASFRNDELDARLIKLIIFNDKRRLETQDIDEWLSKIKEEFQRSDYRPDITIENGNL